MACALWNPFLNGVIIVVALIISRFASGEKQEQPYRTSGSEAPIRVRRSHRPAHTRH
ncbi:hypothetical protein GCM10010272_31780 [Streptomyces lateritius]|nr:hypothetical protein GCM10010272_31780 [Streptomyces lateritius]